MALCLLVHLSLGVSERDVERINERLRTAIEYYIEHPHLKLDTRLKRMLEREVGVRDVEAFREALQEMAPPAPQSAAARAEQQLELDRLVDRAFSAIGDLPPYDYGLIPAEYSLVDAVTSMFLHGGWLHLIGNLFFLYLTGPFLEDVWGRWLYTAFYLLAGALAATGFAMHYPASEVPLIGASGAVAGLMGAFLIRYWSTKIRFIYFFWFIGVGKFDAPAWLMLPLWLARELLFASANPGSVTGDAGGVAHWAHVYGFAFGVAVALVIRQIQLEEKVLSPAIEASISMVDTSFDEALELRASGQHEQALERLQAMLQEDPNSIPVCLAVWGVAVDLGRQQSHLPVLARVVRIEVQNGDAAEAIEHWRELCDNGGHERVPLAAEARLAEQLVDQGDRSGAAEVLSAAAGRVDTTAPIGVLMRLARLATTAAPAVAGSLVAVAEAHPELPEEARSELEALAPVGAAPATPTPPDEPSEPSSEPPPPLPVDVAPRTVRRVEVVPKTLADTGLIVERDGAPSTRLAFETVRAIAVAGIQQPGERGQLLVDLLLDLPEGVADTVRAVRMRSNRFDPRTVMPDAADRSPVDALRLLVERLLERTGAEPLPDRDAAMGRPFAVFSSEALYEQQVLGASPSADG
jgi:membrane associated rhomboid family serine protease